MKMDTEGLPTAGKFSRELTKRLTPKFGEGEARAMTRLIFLYLKGWDATAMVINESTPLSEYFLEKVDGIVKRLENDEPLQYILGLAWFYGMDFKVTPAVLIPRPETAMLVDIIVDENKRDGLHVLDACTGSGCIAVALARHLKFPEITAVDISGEALEVARMNAEKFKCRIDFVQADIFDWDAEPDSLDIIVSNPPYIDESERSGMDANVLRYEPHQALFVPDSDPLRFYRRIAEIGRHALRPEGRIYFEINPRHAAAMRTLMEDLGFRDVEIVKDIHGKDRFLTAGK